MDLSLSLKGNSNNHKRPYISKFDNARDEEIEFILTLKIQIHPHYRRKWVVFKTLLWSKKNLKNDKTFV